MSAVITPIIVSRSVQMLGDDLNQLGEWQLLSLDNNSKARGTLWIDYFALAKEHTFRHAKCRDVNQVA